MPCTEFRQANPGVDHSGVGTPEVTGCQWFHGAARREGLCDKHLGIEEKKEKKKHGVMSKGLEHEINGVMNRELD